MRILSFILMTLNTEEAMYSKEYLTQWELLKSYETLFESIHPAKENSEEAFAWFSDLPHPLFNSIMHLSTTHLSEKVDDLIGKTPQGNPLSFWIHGQNQAEGLLELLKEKNFELLTPCSLMSCDVKPVNASHPDIRHASMAEFSRINAIVYQFDEELNHRYADVLAKIKSENYLLFIGGEAVGTGILFPNGEIGGIFNITVLPEHQKKGYAKAMMQFLMDRAYQLGLKKLVLLSTPDAENLYLSLGFKKGLDIEIFAR